jgi:hypothetical protein
MVGVTLPSSAATLSDGAGHSMTVDTWNSNPNGAFQLNATTGASTFEVGGTLHVASGQTPGTYSGTFDVSVEYQ